MNIFSIFFYFYLYNNCSSSSSIPPSIPNSQSEIISRFIQSECKYLLWITKTSTLPLSISLCNKSLYTFLQNKTAESSLKSIVQYFYQNFLRNNDCTETHIETYLQLKQAYYNWNVMKQKEEWKLLLPIENLMETIFLPYHIFPPGKYSLNTYNSLKELSITLRECEPLLHPIGICREDIFKLNAKLYLDKIPWNKKIPKEYYLHRLQFIETLKHIKSAILEEVVLLINDMTNPLTNGVNGIDILLILSNVLTVSQPIFQSGLSDLTLLSIIFGQDQSLDKSEELVALGNDWASIENGINPNGKCSVYYQLNGDILFQPFLLLAWLQRNINRAETQHMIKKYGSKSQYYKTDIEKACKESIRLRRILVSRLTFQPENVLYSEGDIPGTSNNKIQTFDTDTSLDLEELEMNTQRLKRRKKEKDMEISIPVLQENIFDTPNRFDTKLNFRSLATDVLGNRPAGEILSYGGGQQEAFDSAEIQNMLGYSITTADQTSYSTIQDIQHLNHPMESFTPLATTFLRNDSGDEQQAFNSADLQNKIGYSITNAEQSYRVTDNNIPDYNALLKLETVQIPTYSSFYEQSSINAPIYNPTIREPDIKKETNIIPPYNSMDENNPSNGLTYEEPIPSITALETDDIYFDFDDLLLEWAAHDNTAESSRIQNNNPIERNENIKLPSNQPRNTYFDKDK